MDEFGRAMGARTAEDLKTGYYDDHRPDGMTDEEYEDYVWSIAQARNHYRDPGPLPDLPKLRVRRERNDPGSDPWAGVRIGYRSDAPERTEIVYGDLPFGVFRENDGSFTWFFPHVVPVVLGMSKTMRRTNGLSGCENKRLITDVPNGTCGYCMSDETRLGGTESYHTMTHCPMMFEGRWPADMWNGQCATAAHFYAHAMYDLRRQPITPYDPKNERQAINYQYKIRSAAERGQVLGMKYHEHRLQVIQHQPADRTVINRLERFKRRTAMVIEERTGGSENQNDAGWSEPDWSKKDWWRKYGDGGGWSAYQQEPPSDMDWDDKANKDFRGWQVPMNLVPAKRPLERQSDDRRWAGWTNQ